MDSELKRLKKRVEAAEEELESCPVDKTDRYLARYIQAREDYNFVAQSPPEAPQ